MRIKAIGGIVSFLLIILSILLFIEDDPKIKILTSPKIYSIMKSSDNEIFNITILTNDIDSYYFNQDYISNISLSSDSDKIVTLSLSDISKSSERYIYNNEVYYYLSFKLKVGFDSDDYLIEMRTAYLDIKYSNNNEIKLYIGEFNYLFYDEENRDISLNNLLSTHGLVNGIDTSTGLFLNLGNLSEHNITINKIEIGATSTLANNYYLLELYEIPDFSASPEEILGIEDYNYTKYSEYTQKNILLRKNNEIMLYVPFSYEGDISYLYRFYVKVYYIINLEEKVFIIDDFPYISTNVFKEELEGEYNYYEFNN